MSAIAKVGSGETLYHCKVFNNIFIISIACSLIFCKYLLIYMYSIPFHANIVNKVLMIMMIMIKVFFFYS